MLRRQLEELVAVYPTAKLWQMQVRHQAVCVGGAVCQHWPSLQPSRILVKNHYRILYFRSSTS